MLVQSNSGDFLSLIAIRDSWNAAGGMNVFLFQNDVGCSETMDAVNPFVQSNFPGYAVRVATGWTGPDALVAIPFIHAPAVVWTRVAGSPSPQFAYGYYCERVDSPGTIYFAERFASPIDMSDEGDAITLFLRYTQDTFYHGP